MEENMENIFTGKTVEEATAEGLKALGITADEAEIEVLEEGKRKLFGSVKAKVKVVKKATDSERAVNFIDGLMGILNITAVTEVVSDGEKIEIKIETTNTSAVIGRRGEVLDAIQCLAGAVANIGRDEYRRVSVDCENYRAQREEKLKNVAIAKAAKAVEKKRRVALEPMSPYERRVVHSVLASNEEVTTVSEGKEPTRRVVIIPKNEVPFERKEKFNRGRQFNRDKRDDRGEKKYGERKFNRDRRDGDRRDRGDRSSRPPRSSAPRSSAPRSSAPRGKKQIYLGTYLGNSGAGKEAEGTNNTNSTNNNNNEQ